MTTPTLAELTALRRQRLTDHYDEADRLCRMRSRFYAEATAQPDMPITREDMARLFPAQQHPKPSKWVFAPDVWQAFLCSLNREEFYQNVNLPTYSDGIWRDAHLQGLPVELDPLHKGWELR